MMDDPKRSWDKIQEFLDSSEESTKDGQIPKEILENPLKEAIHKHEQGAVIMLKLPTKAYFEANMVSVKFLTANKYEGIYVSFQRPFNNLSLLFRQKQIDLNRLFIVDAATAFCGERLEQHPRCLQISSTVDLDELFQVLCVSLSGIKSKKRFVFIDSLTTLALYTSLPETMKFLNLLVSKVKTQEFENVLLFLNVAHDLSQKQFIKDLELLTDEVIDVEHSWGHNVDEVVNVVS